MVLEYLIYLLTFNSIMAQGKGERVREDITISQGQDMMRASCKSHREREAQEIRNTKGSRRTAGGEGVRFGSLGNYFGRHGQLQPAIPNLWILWDWRLVSWDPFSQDMET